MFALLIKCFSKLWNLFGFITSTLLIRALQANVIFSFAVLIKVLLPTQRLSVNNNIGLRIQYFMPLAAISDEVTINVFFHTSFPVFMLEFQLKCLDL